MCRYDVWKCALLVRRSHTLSYGRRVWTVAYSRVVPISSVHKNYYVEIINEPKLIGATENRQLSRPSIHMRGCGYAGLIHRCACVDVSS